MLWCVSVTDLHQQGADHRVDSARVGDGGHLVATQYVGPQGLCADLQIHLTCVHTNSVYWQLGCIDCRSLSLLSHFVYGGRTAFLLAFQSDSLSSLRLHPSSSPCVLCYSPSLIPICCLIILPLPHTLTPSLPSFLHSPQSFTEDKYRSPPEGAVSDCFVRDTTWLVSTSDCQHSSQGERNLTFIRALSPSMLMEADRNPLLSGQTALQQQLAAVQHATAVSALNPE